MDTILDAHFATRGGNPVHHAFPLRRAVLPWRHKRPLPADQVPAIWQQLSRQQGPSRHRLAYVHVPFCANHCLFCGFYRNAYSVAATASYTDLLVDDIARDAASPLASGTPVQALYLGGGTPSALSAQQLERVLLALRRHLPLAPDCEITLEGRITHFDADKLQACLSAGVNRISIGVQTFDTRVRRRQGRKSSREQAIRFLEFLRTQQQAAIVIDLLYGLPGQTPAIWREDLYTALALAPDGIDLYGLNLIPGTPLHKSVAAGKFSVTASLPDLGDMYSTGTDLFHAAGWEQLSNSHWRRTSRERSLYNLRIKEGADCLAYGSGAGGQIGRYSYAIAGDLQAYAQAIQAGHKPLSGIHIADALQPARQYMTAGFEVGRLDATGLYRLMPAEIHDACDTLLRQWQSAGLLHYDGQTAALTTAGRFWYSNLIFAFDAVLARSASAASPCPQPSTAPAQTMSSTSPAPHPTTDHTAHDTVRTELATNPGGILESLAASHHLPLQAVIQCLPSGMWKLAPGDRFIDALQDIATWGDVTTVVHTKDAILEFEGPVPQGSVGHGFYNLHGKGGLAGHLRADHCKAIAFVRRPFMGSHTLSVQFLNADGDAMFKIFVGRDAQRRLKDDQIQCFDKLEARLAA